MLRGGASAAVRLVRPSVPYVSPSDVILNMRRGAGRRSSGGAGAVDAATPALRSPMLVMLRVWPPASRSTARAGGGWGLAASVGGVGLLGGGGADACADVGPGSTGGGAAGACGGLTEGAGIRAFTIAGDRSATRITARAM